ncbi:MAG: hypothetical protein IPL40_07295 [Proteobacteria bacterium]|nr:hypothetical protein [Pseudomonadota bacterium]
MWHRLFGPCFVLMLASGLVALHAGGGCAPLRKDQTVCAPDRRLRCVGTASCAWDRQRHCRSCQCDALQAVPRPPPPDRPQPAGAEPPTAPWP